MANEKGQQQTHRNSALYNKEIAKVFSVIGHDLKAPLSSIKAFSSLIEEDFDNYSKDELIRFNKQISESAEVLLKLLENLLNWGQIQTKSMKISRRFIFVHPLVEESFKLLKYSAVKKGIRLVNDVNADLKVYANKMMIETAIRNLTDNALKFTSKGGSISVSSRKDGDDAIIAVRDTGIGIPKEKLNKLFKTDGLYSDRGTEGEKGTGLGLLICKEFITKNNGKIKVESEPDNGTTFYVTLPIRKF